MNRVIVICQHNGVEKALAHFTFVNRSPGFGRILEVQYPAGHQSDVFHFSFKNNEIVLQSSTHVGLHFRFCPSWSFRINGHVCEVVHGADLLDLIYQEILESTVKA